MPRQLIAATGKQNVSAGALLTARLLGVRHVVQATTRLASPATLVVRLGAAADALHGLSAFGLAIIDRRWRRVALLDAAAATSFAAAGVRELARATEGS